MEPKYRKFYVDWWNIKKSHVYGVIGTIAFLGLLIGGGWWLVKSGWLFADADSIEIPKDAARLESFEGDVRITRAATRQTEKVATKTYILAGDTIQTQAEGKAQIRMIDGSVLSIRPNSTVVIRSSTSLFGGTDVRVSLGDGQINVKTEDQTEASQNVVEIKESENRLFSQTDASFNINQKSGGGEIRISRGGVETNIGGEKTVIKDNEFASINNGRISAKEKLLGAPKLIAPPALEQILTSSSGAADVTFRWQKPDGSAAAAATGSYHLQVSTSPFFVADGMVKESDALPSPSLVLANVSPGTYYWRIRATNASGQASEWSEPWRFTVLKREEGDAINATGWQVESLGGRVYRVGGKTQPGAIVRVLGRETFAAGDGSFILQVSATSPEVTVEISDEHG
ncbi:MAG TPA: FecR domain-containing protein, partial [Pyrinomonadaceae bacterium]|nr:FecR domain-containing protein [Pyrinomonadaceae bacterium]